MSTTETQLAPWIEPVNDPRIVEEMFDLDAIRRLVFLDEDELLCEPVNEVLL